MTIFYIDTSSSFLYTAIYQNDQIINKKALNLSKDLSTFTVDEVNKMFQEVHLEPQDIDKIIVVNGPGSFTGIRIGVTLAKIFAFTLHKKITTISSLEAMKESIETDKIIVPIIDARRKCCYAAIYKNDEPIMKECYLSLENLQATLDNLKTEYIFVSNDQFSFKTEKYQPDFLRIIRKYQDRKEINQHLVNPSYLKLTEAEENKIKEE